MDRHLVELKARVTSGEEVRRRLESAGAVLERTIRQKDVYFENVVGRLKHRAEVPGQNQLVYYQRPNVKSTKESRIRLESIPPGDNLLTHLSNTLGVQTVVEKTRRVYRWKDTQVHIDLVDGLGEFLEFEHEVMDPAEVGSWHERLMEMFLELGGSRDDLIEGSYSDMLGATR